MAELITDEGEFQRLYAKHTEISDKLNLKLSIEPDTVKIWKELGYFKHIREQISPIDGVYVACKKRITPSKKTMHDFFFMCETEDTSAKIYDMINSYFEHEVVKAFSESDPHIDIGFSQQYGEFSKGCINTACHIL